MSPIDQEYVKKYLSNGPDKKESNKRIEHVGMQKGSCFIKMDESYSVDTLGNPRTQYRYATAGRYTGQLSLMTQPRLCEECNRNQSSKIQELNSFEPFRESNFQSELDVHKQQLDERYKLCQSCRDIVIQHLKTQAVDLKTFLLGNHLQQSKSTPTKLLKRTSSPESIFVLLAQLSCVLLASMLVCSELSLSNGHHTFGETFRFWNSSFMSGGAFFSSLNNTNVMNMVKHFVLHFTRTVRVTSRFWERGKELLLHFSSTSLTMRRYLHVCLLCLLLNMFMFLKRKSRFGVLILLSWTCLSVLRCWEVFLLKADCSWRFTGAVFCWFLNASLFLVSLLSYSKVLGMRKRRRYKFPSSEANSPEKHVKTETGIIETEKKATTPSSDKRATELDCNLNGLSLGLSAKRKNGYNRDLSPAKYGQKGSFWSQTVNNGSKESPLVSMHQRPLIVPATLHYSGLQQRVNANHTQETANVSRTHGINSFAMSSDDDSSSESMDEELSGQNLPVCNDEQTALEKPRRKRKRSPSSAKTQASRFVARTFLLIASLVLNLYFIVSFTEWPVRVLQSLWKIMKR